MRLDEHYLACYMLDVSGHGVPAALVTVSVHQRLGAPTGFATKRRLNVPPYYEIVPPKKYCAVWMRNIPSNASISSLPLFTWF